MLLEIGLKSLVDEFTTIIGMKNFYLERELSLNHGMKCLENGKKFIFDFKLIKPRHLSTIVDKNYKPAVTKRSSYREWSPHI